jgi:hypothetical protein
VFEPRRVTLGTAYGDFITVTSGLVAGDRVAISGNFLIDSESRMHSSGMSSLNGKPDVPGKIQASVITPLSESPEKHLQKLQAMQITAGVEVDTLTRTPGAPRGARRGAND